MIAATTKTIENAMAHTVCAAKGSTTSARRTVRSMSTELVTATTRTAYAHIGRNARAAVMAASPGNAAIQNPCTV